MASLDISLPIIPGKGIGDLKLGTPVREFLEDIRNITYSQVKAHAWLWRTYVFRLWDSIDLGIDICNGELSQIVVYGDFSGKVEGKIGIGSTVRELREWRSDLDFDEHRISVGEWEMVVVTDYGDDIPSIEEVLNNKIVSIKIEIPMWQRR